MTKGFVDPLLHWLLIHEVETRIAKPPWQNDVAPSVMIEGAVAGALTVVTDVAAVAPLQPLKL